MKRGDPPNEKSPELGNSGLCTQRVDGGRGLAVRDAVCLLIRE